MNKNIDQIIDAGLWSIMAIYYVLYAELGESDSRAIFHETILCDFARKHQLDLAEVAEVAFFLAEQMSTKPWAFLMLADGKQAVHKFRYQPESNESVRAFLAEGLTQVSFDLPQKTPHEPPNS